MIDHDVRSPWPSRFGGPTTASTVTGATGLVLDAALVAMALVTGLIDTFSVAVMTNLSGADDRTFVATIR